MPPRDRDIDTDEYEFPEGDRRRGGDALSWRVGALERAVRAKADSKDVDNLEKDINSVADELNSLRRAIVIFSLSMIGTGGMFQCRRNQSLQRGQCQRKRSDQRRAGTGLRLARVLPASPCGCWQPHRIQGW